METVMCMYVRIAQIASILMLTITQRKRQKTKEMSSHNMLSSFEGILVTQFSSNVGNAEQNLGCLSK